VRTRAPSDRARGSPAARRIVADAAGVGPKPFVPGDVGSFEHVAEPGKLVVVADREHEMAVAGGEHVLRLDVRMGVSGAPRRRPEIR
jgi:hypothetical protein